MFLHDAPAFDEILKTLIAAETAINRA